MYGIASQVATVWCRSILSEASNVECVSELHVLSTIKARAITFDIIDLICNCSTVTGAAIRMSEVRAALSGSRNAIGGRSG